MNREPLSLGEIQRRVAKVVMQPLARDEHMRQRMLDRRSVIREAEALIKPNRRLSSFERLEIYNRQYWFRILSCFTEDFPGLRAVLGDRRFDTMMRAYLAECPSTSFSLRNLGSRLEQWLRSNLKWIQPRETLAMDMARLEWAHIEAFDGGCEPRLDLKDLLSTESEPHISLQPYVRLLHVSYPVDDLLIAVHNHDDEADSADHWAAREIRRQVANFARSEPQSLYIAVHRMEDSVYYKRLSVEAYRLLEALRQGKPLSSALDEAFENSAVPEEDRPSTIHEWFQNWAELGWFCRPASMDGINCCFGAFRG